MKKILEIIKMNIMENEQGNLSLDKRILDQESWDKKYISKYYRLGFRGSSPAHKIIYRHYRIQKYQHSNS